MQCPHCSVAFRDIWHRNRMKYDNGFDAGWECITTVCPECHKPSIKISGTLSPTGTPVVDVLSKALAKEQWVYPISRRGAHFGNKVPDEFKNDYLEACEILLVSPRSSATLSRRILEAVLGEQGYRQSKISERIEAARNESVPDKKLPTVLLTIIDVVRQFGNFSAHQKKSVLTFQIIEVEPGEAELCLEIVEGLFEHYYVRPAIEREKVEKINQKLQQLGRDPLPGAPAA